MINIHLRQYGQNYADNILNKALLFDTGTWSVTSGTGTVVLNNTTSFVSEKSLHLQNNSVTNNLIVNNTSQNTTIFQNGNYKFSLYAKSDNSISASVLVYVNSSLLDTQTFDLEPGNNWQRFLANTEYTLNANDVITFQFQINADKESRESTHNLYIDGVMLNKADRGNAMPPIYTKPL